MKPIVHILRGGAPDKISRWTDGSYEVRLHDNTNLVDYTRNEVFDIISRCELILPADEGDIRHANKIYDRDDLYDQSWILLPHENIGEGYCKVIDYDKFVPKDSLIYRNLVGLTPFGYMDFYSMSIEEFLKQWTLSDLDDSDGEGLALKSTTGSGSRGVLILDKERSKFGGSFVSQITEAQYQKFIEFCKKENCRVMIQDLIPTGLTKINVDFVIRDGKLLGYMWTIPNQTQLQTNWDNGYIVRNEFTDYIMNEVKLIMEHHGIWNAIMNFEAFTDMKSQVILIEWNWRYSNSMFQAQAAGIDLVGQYLRNEPFSMPKGEHKFSRYWQCKFYKNIPGYHDGK